MKVTFLFFFYKKSKINHCYRISKNSQTRTYSLYRASVTMWSLEIRTQRIFNNLIKQNQKLASDFVLKQSKIMSSAQSPGYKVQHPTSNVQRRESRIQRPGSSVQSPASRVQRPTPASRAKEFRYAIICYFQQVLYLNPGLFA